MTSRVAADPEAPAPAPAPAPGPAATPAPSAKSPALAIQTELCVKLSRALRSSGLPEAIEIAKNPAAVGGLLKDLIARIAAEKRIALKIAPGGVMDKLPPEKVAELQALIRSDVLDKLIPAMQQVHATRTLAPEELEKLDAKAQALKRSIVTDTIAGRSAPQETKTWLELYKPRTPQAAVLLYETVLGFLRRDWPAVAQIKGSAWPVLTGRALAELDLQRPEDAMSHFRELKAAAEFIGEAIESGEMSDVYDPEAGDFRDAGSELARALVWLNAQIGPGAADAKEWLNRTYADTRGRGIFRDGEGAGLNVDHAAFSARPQELDPDYRRQVDQGLRRTQEDINQMYDQQEKAREERLRQMERGEYVPPAAPVKEPTQTSREEKWQRAFDEATADSGLSPEELDDLRFRWTEALQKAGYTWMDAEPFGPGSGDASDIEDRINFFNSLDTAMSDVLEAYSTAWAERPKRAPFEPIQRLLNRLPLDAFIVEEINRRAEQAGMKPLLSPVTPNNRSFGPWRVTVPIPGWNRKDVEFAMKPTRPVRKLQSKRADTGAAGATSATDLEAVVRAIVQGLERQPLEWTEDILNGESTEHAVVGADQLRSLLADSLAEDEVDDVVQILTSPEGLQAMSDILVAEGFGDVAHQGPAQVILYRGVE